MEGSMPTSDAYTNAKKQNKSAIFKAHLNISYFQDFFVSIFKQIQGCVLLFLSLAFCG
jgi:AAA15 family ATPase/GTPase